MGDIFISYSRHDAALVDQFVDVLTKAGMKAWVDREDIKIGNSWRVQIVEAIDGCDAFVLMLSSSSVVSPNVHKEVILAQDSARPTYVVMLEVVRLAPEIRYPLAGLQFINVPLLGFEKSAQKLVESLEPHVKKNDAPAQKQAELVIQGVDLAAFDSDKQAQLLAFLSNLTNTDPSQLSIASLTAGSVHAFIDMPAAAAFQLKTLALNSDPRFQELGIVSIKLVGDQHYIRISDGSFISNAADSKIANWIKILAALILILLLGFCALQRGSMMRPPGMAASATPTFTPDPLILIVTVTEMNSASSSAEPVATATEIVNAPAADTSTPTATRTPTVTAVPLASLKGTVSSEQLACRYGPGGVYLYMYGLIQGNPIEAIGWMDTADGPWLYVNFGGDRPCWVNADFVHLQGDYTALAPGYYPQNAPLIQFDHPKFPPPAEVEAARKGDEVEIHWKGYELAPGDRESADSPVYLVEAWVCRGGQLVFTAYGSYIESALIVDEAGCGEPSHGQVYIAHKDGYIGPVPIPWPAQ